MSECFNDAKQNYRISVKRV